VCKGFESNDGDADETKIADLLEQLLDDCVESGVDMSKLVVNLSFGGYYPDDEPPPQIAARIMQFVSQGAVVVASAGNEASCRKKYPAAMPEVIGVGALDECGPAWFSNYGDWVDASAPGVDLVSEFFTYNGKFAPADGSGAEDFDDFDGWATWSGTSFSTPAVVAALVQIINLYECSAEDAKRILLGRSGLFRLPQYGVVVNRIF
jgi:subtilisin family serine protease